LKEGKSPYVRYGKQPYAYQFQRCSHSKTHTEAFGIGDAKHRQRVRVEVCDVCNTIQSQPKFERLQVFRKAA
jgi:hypothetical protein